MTAPKPAKYTVVRLQDITGLAVDSITDETKARGRPTGIKGEYVLPGPRAAGTTKTVAANISARKVVGYDGVKLSAWASARANSAPPPNAASSACPVVVIAR